MRALGIALAGVGALSVPLVGALRNGASLAEAIEDLRTRVEAVAGSVASAVSTGVRAERAGTSRSTAVPPTESHAAERALVAVAPRESAARVAPATAPSLPPEPELVLVATSKETIVYARPSAKAPKLGYLRSGAIVSRDAEPASFDGCRGGFYGIVPEGFVCVGTNASIDRQHDVARAVQRRADRTAPLPYVYGVAPVGGAPMYSRIPAEAERKNAEQGVYAARGDEKSFDGVPVDPVPWFLTDSAPSIAPNGVRFSPTALLVGSPTPRSGFAFTSVFAAAGRRFGLTVDMTLVPLDRVTKVEPSRFHGIPLVGSAELPVVFTRSKSAALYSGDPQRAGLKLERRLEFREAVPITGRRARANDLSYLETRDGNWIVDKDLLRVNTRQDMPAWATSGRTWIDVSISKQTLVAYEGTRPVFVTLVSTGIDGAGDPATTHSTIQGQFLIHTKHVTTTMDGDEAGDEFDLREVPYVQYFKDGFALHAAYWHDGFGVPRSHGCVNLSPLDSRWLFAWTEPHVPTSWHGAMSARGTLVSVRE
jgi:hypothetical protein